MTSILNCCWSSSSSESKQCFCPAQVFFFASFGHREWRYLKGLKGMNISSWFLTRHFPQKCCISTFFLRVEWVVGALPLFLHIITSSYIPDNKVTIFRTFHAAKQQRRLSALVSLPPIYSHILCEERIFLLFTASSPLIEHFCCFYCIVAAFKAR